MTNYRFAYYVSEKKLTRGVAEQVALGARLHGDSVELVPQTQELNPADYDGAICLGMSMAVKNTWHRFREAGKFFVFMDKGYTGKGLFWRFSVNDWQPLAYFQRFARDSARLKMTQLRLKPMMDIAHAKPDFKIVFAGACQAYNNLMDLGNINEYNIEVVQKIKEHTTRSVVYRPNPAWAINHSEEVPPIEGTEWSPPDILFNSVFPCWLVIAHGSSVTLHAMARGTPIMVLGGGIARPLALTEADWDKLDTPKIPTDRERQQLLCDVSYCQWTMKEYRSGEAWAELRLVLSALSDPSEITAAELIRQYEIMHRSPKYFRGRSLVKEFRNVADLVVKTSSSTILDFGSGKGEQYKRPYQLDKAWRVAVTCYDPGIPEVATLPEGKFDGVICCDVMEHVLPEEVPATLQRIMSYAHKFVFFSIAVSPAKKNMPDGRNCHVTVQPPEWWHEQIRIARKLARFKGELSVVFSTDDDE